MFTGLVARCVAFSAGKSLKLGEYGLLHNSTSSKKLIYSNDSIVNGVSLGAYYTNCGAAGNHTTGMFAGGDTGANSATLNTQLYVFANNAMSSGAKLGQAKYDIAGAGNAEFAIFAGGNPSWVAYANRYTYSTNTMVQATSLGMARAAMGACGDSTVGIFGGGDKSTTTPHTNYVDRYTYSNGSRVAGTVLGSARMYLGATSGETFGLFAGGRATVSGSTVVSSYTERYTYATSAVAPATALSTTRWGIVATGNKQSGYFLSGVKPDFNTDNVMDKYSYTDLTRTTGTTLGVQSRNSAVSSVPGGF